MLETTLFKFIFPDYCCGNNSYGERLLDQVPSGRALGMSAEPLSFDLQYFYFWPGFLTEILPLPMFIS